MQLALLPPDLQSLVEQRLATGAYADAEDVLRCALEAQAFEDDWTEDQRCAIVAKIEDSIAQAERGELLDADQAWREIDEHKQEWLAQRAAK